MRFNSLLFCALVVLFTAPSQVLAQAITTDPVTNICSTTGSDLSSAQQAFSQGCTNLERPSCELSGVSTWTCTNTTARDCAVNGDTFLDTFAVFEYNCMPYDEQESTFTFSQLNTALGCVSVSSDYREGFASFESECRPYEEDSLAQYVITKDVPVIPDAVAVPLEDASPENDEIVEGTTDSTTEELASFSLVSTGFITALVPGATTWGDSYLGTDGQCWPRSSFDHGIGGIQITTGSGETLTIREAAALLGDSPSMYEDYTFNDVNCGNGPANDYGDEDTNQCPGLVTRGTSGCSYISTAANWWDRL